VAGDRRAEVPRKRARVDPMARRVCDDEVLVGVTATDKQLLGVLPGAVRLQYRDERSVARRASRNGI